MGSGGSNGSKRQPLEVQPLEVQPLGGQPLDQPLNQPLNQPLDTAAGANRRSADRVDVTWSVDCATEDTFLYASIANISAMGIFVRTEEPLPRGTELTLRFSPEPPAEGPEMLLRGVVQWINPVKPGGDNLNPGMGVQFVDLDLPTRELLVEAVRTIAYLRPDALARTTD
jgi:type IV pilus assembly protein PilZ